MKFLILNNQLILKMTKIKFLMNIKFC